MRHRGFDLVAVRGDPGVDVRGFLGAKLKVGGRLRRRRTRRLVDFRKLLDASRRLGRRRVQASHRVVARGGARFLVVGLVDPSEALERGEPSALVPAVLGVNVQRGVVPVRCWRRGLEAGERPPAAGRLLGWLLPRRAHLDVFNRIDIFNRLDAFNRAEHRPAFPRVFRGVRGEVHVDAVVKTGERVRIGEPAERPKRARDVHTAVRASSRRLGPSFAMLIFLPAVRVLHSPGGIR